MNRKPVEMKFHILIATLLLDILALSAQSGFKMEFPEPIAEPDRESGDKELLSEKKYGYYNLDDKGNFHLIIQYSYKDARQFSELTRFAMVKNFSDKWGLIDITGHPQCLFVYDEIEGSNDSRLYKVKMDGKWGLLDGCGYSVITCMYDTMDDLYNGWYEV